MRMCVRVWVSGHACADQVMSPIICCYAGMKELLSEAASNSISLASSPGVALT